MMRPFYLKLFSAAAVVIFISALVTNLFSYNDYNDGIVGLTNRNGGFGCTCHGLGVPDSTVHVFFTGLDSVAVGQTVYGKLKIVGGPHVAGGLDVAVLRGRLDTTNIDTIIQKIMVIYSQNDSGYEVTHRFPKFFVNDTCTFTFKYTAPSTPGWDTLYANGNSVNLDTMADTNDHWNFSANTPVRIYIPIGIANIGTIVNNYSLEQNYPNPFNPSTNIDFDLPKEGYVTLNIYDISGRLVKTVVDQNLKAGKYKTSFDGTSLASGVYIYRINIGDFTQTRKMILLK